MQEQREVSDIAGLSSQYNAGNAMMWQGIGGIAQSGMSALSNPKLWDGKDGGGTGTTGGTTIPATNTTSNQTVMNDYINNFGDRFNMNQFARTV